ncbi:hypothetical protein HGA91_00255 [candidate division WWE3 bacterium]|nr:hypothetical protein [candidate division WWE3 bacterium]
MPLLEQQELLQQGQWPVALSRIRKTIVLRQWQSSDSVRLEKLPQTHPTNSVSRRPDDSRSSSAPFHRYDRSN